MTADPLPLTELLDQLERLVDGATPTPWQVSRRDRDSWRIEKSLPCINGLSAMFEMAVVHDPEEAESGYTDGALSPDEAEARARTIVAAVNLLRPMVEALRAANKVDEREADGHADQGDGFCDACEAPLPCSYADLSARLAALRDAAALELEEKK